MKKTVYFLLVVTLFSCTSNTILEKPEDLIPKDTMSLVIQELMIASSAKFIKTKDMQKNINYMPFVYNRFKIDSSRFQRSNLYYMSKIDDYIKIFDNAKTSLDNQKSYYDKLKKETDSIRKDSLTKIKKEKLVLDSIKRDSTKKSDELNLTKLDSVKTLPDF